MLKRYYSSSCVSLNLRINGATAHITFEGKTGGGSVYYSDNETEQAALESHPRFGQWYKAEEVQVEAANETETQTQIQTLSESNALEFKTVEEAKDYLSDKYAISRTKLRNKEAVIAAAAEKGLEIKFV